MNVRLTVVNPGAATIKLSLPRSVIHCVVPDCLMRSLSIAPWLTLRSFSIVKLPVMRFTTPFCSVTEFEASDHPVRNICPLYVWLAVTHTKFGEVRLVITALVDGSIRLH